MRGFSFYGFLLVLGFLLLIIGGFIAFSSGSSQQTSFDRPSALSNAAIGLLVGSFMALMGILLIFIGGWSSFRRPAYPYY